MPKAVNNGNGARRERLSNRIDRTVALRDRELGIGSSSYAAGIVNALNRPNAGSADSTIGNLQSAVPPPTPPPGPHRPTDATLGIPGTPIISGFLEDLGEYNGELAGRNALPIYEKMRRGDAQVRATLAACKLPIQSARWEVIPGLDRISAFGVQRSQYAEPIPVSSSGAGRLTEAKAKEVAQFVRANLFGGLEFRTSTGGWATQNWDDVVRNALLMVDFGCAVHEDVWTVDGSVIRLRKLAARLPITFYRWHTEADGETLLALEQYGYRAGRYLNVIVPAEKCTVFTHQQEGANFWGISLQRPMYPHWYVKSQLYRIDAIACERNSLGVPVFKLAPGFSKEDRDAAYSFVTQLAAHEATGMVEPPGDANSGFRIVGYEGRVRDVAPSIEHHNVMISRAALALFLDLGQSEHGSRALGKEHGDFFLLALQNLADQVALAITNTSVRRLVSYNFGDDAPVPRLVASNVQARGLADIVEALTQFAQAGLVVSEENLRGFIRQELALPVESKKGVLGPAGMSVGPKNEATEQAN